VLNHDYACDDTASGSAKVTRAVCWRGIDLAIAMLAREQQAARGRDRIHRYVGPRVPLEGGHIPAHQIWRPELALKIDEIERIDRLIMSAEARRNAVLREVDRHRASVAHVLRQAADYIEDAQFEELGAKQNRGFERCVINAYKLSANPGRHARSYAAS
jgi:hypothetical protein